jgi:ATP-dependent protease ClpP protease subunit
MRNWYKFIAKTKEAAELLIYEQIGKDWWSGEGVGAKQFAEDLKALGEITELDVRLNSPGGDVFDGNAIYNILRQHKAKKTVFIDGIAASIASVIAMAGDRILIPENAMIMIHDPSSLAWGNADDMRKMGETLDKIKTGMVAAYTRKTKRSEAEVGRWMSEETWFTADEAKQYGFADELLEPVQMAASFDLAKLRFKHVPTALVLAPSGDGQDQDQDPDLDLAGRRLRLVPHGA